MDKLQSRLLISDFLSPKCLLSSVFLLVCLIVVVFICVLPVPTSINISSCIHQPQNFFSTFLNVHMKCRRHFLDSLIKFSACLLHILLPDDLNTLHRTHRSKYRGNESPNDAGPEPGTGARQADVRTEGTTDNQRRQGNDYQQQNIHRGWEELSIRVQTKFQEEEQPLRFNQNPIRVLIVLPT